MFLLLIFSSQYHNKVAVTEVRLMDPKISPPNFNFWKLKHICNSVGKWSCLVVDSSGGFHPVWMVE